jgi:hypothetical protein
MGAESAAKARLSAPVPNIIAQPAASIAEEPNHRDQGI